MTWSCNLNMLLPSVLSRLLQFLPHKDRLNLRATCKDLEKTIAKTDLHVCNMETGIVTIMKIFGSFQLHLGSWLVFKVEDDDESIQNLLRLRHRLCKRIITDSVHVRYIDYNIIDVDFIIALIGECEFNLLWINVSLDEYHPSLLDFVRKHSTYRVKLIAHDFLIDYETIRSLPRLRQLSCVGNINDCCDDEQFLELVRKRHGLLEVPVLDLDPSSIVEAIKIVAECAGEHHVIMEVDSTFIVRFVHHIGLRRVGNEFEEQPDFDHSFTIETYDIDDPFDADAGWPTESFALRYDIAVVNLSYPLDDETTQINITISKYASTEE